VPTMAEYVLGYEASAWYGAPKGTPAEIISKLNNGINAALASPVTKARLADLGAAVFPGSPAEFGKFIAGETEKWARVIKSAGIRAQ
jgi:tripartite-type tricarboxylate transporter receptor subunit TctC